MPGRSRSNSHVRAGLVRCQATSFVLKENQLSNFFKQGAGGSPKFRFNSSLRWRSASFESLPLGSSRTLFVGFAATYRAFPTVWTEADDGVRFLLCRKGEVFE